VCLALAACALVAAAPTTTPAGRGGGPRKGRVLVVPIHGAIDRVQGAFLHRVLSNVSDEYDAVIFELNTPGGRLDIMSQMSRDMIAVAPTRTIAFVSPWAISAGAGIAMSTDIIYMEPGSAIGAARVYLMGPNGPIALPKAIDEKYKSATRAMFESIAETKKYPTAIAIGMADETYEVKKVTYEGKVQYLDGNEIKAIEADPLKKEKLKIIKTVSEKDKLITLTAQKAAEFDIARGGVADNLKDVLAKEGLAGFEIVRKGQTWGDRAIAFLTIPQLVMVLILIGFGGIWLEMKIPGFGFPGTIAVVAFLLVFASQFLVGNANALEIMLFIVGLALLAIELFVTPGFGFIGGGGIACVFISLLLAMQSFTVPNQPWHFELLTSNLLAVMGGVGGSLVLLLILAWVIPSTPLFRRLALRSQLTTEGGFSAGIEEGDALVGQVGTVTTQLRPAGKMEIGDSSYSVVSDGEIVESGARVRVIRVDGPRIVVEPLPPEQAKEPDFQP